MLSVSRIDFQNQFTEIKYMTKQFPSRVAWQWLCRKRCLRVLIRVFPLQLLKCCLFFLSLPPIPLLYSINCSYLTLHRSTWVLKLICPRKTKTDEATNIIVGQISYPLLDIFLSYQCSILLRKYQLSGNNHFSHHVSLYVNHFYP